MNRDHLPILFIPILAIYGLLGIGGAAQASTDVQIVVASGTAARVVVSTGTAFRVDNRVNGSTVTHQSTRVAVFIQNQDSADDVYCGYNSDVSTNTANNQLGVQIQPTDSVTFGLLRQAALWCICVDAAGVDGCVTSVHNLHKE